MGSLSNLYISQSYQSLAHLGTNNALVSGTMTVLQDGLGNSLNIFFDGTNISSSGNIFAANLTGSGILPAGVISSSAQISTLGFVSSSVTASSLITASFDNGTRNLTFTKGNNTTFAVNIPDTSGSAGNFVTTSSFNAYTASNDQKVSSLEANSASVNTSITNINSATSSLFASASLALVTASFDNGTRNLTFTKGDTQTFSVNIPDVSGSTGNFATTGSNIFVGNQTVTGSLFISGNINMVNGADIVTHHVRAQGSNGLELQTSAGTVIVAMGQGGGTQAGFVGALSANSFSSSTINGLGDPLAFSTSVDSRLDGLEASTASLFTSASLALVTASVSLNTITFTKGDGTTFPITINTGSGGGGGATFPYTGSAEITGSLGLTGSFGINDNVNINTTITPISGTLLLTAKNITPTSTIIAAVTNSVNLAFKSGTGGATNIMSGSNNIFAIATATAGFNRVLTNGNIALNVQPNISASMAFPVTISNNYLTSGITTRGPVSSSAYTISNNIVNAAVSLGSNAANNFERAIAGASISTNYIGGATAIVATKTPLSASVNLNNNIITGTGGALTANLNSSSVAITSNLILGGLTINADHTYSGSFASTQARLDVGTSAFIGSGHIVQSTGLSTSTRGLSNALIVGGTNTVKLSGDNALGNLSAVALIGSNLALSGSTTQNIFGTVIVGRENSLESSLIDAGRVVFAVGTGNAATSTKLTGFLIDSGSNTTISGSLLISGAAFLNGVSLGAGAINTGSFATTGSNFFNGNQRITGSLIVSGAFETTQDMTIQDASGNPTLKIGRGAGNQPSNLRFGVQALATTGVGLNNIAIGNSAMHYSSQSLATENIAIGGESLQYTQEGQQIAIGSSALRYTTTGKENLAVGAFAMQNNITGTQNIAIGFNSLYNHTDGTRNIAIGPSSAQNFRSGSNNIFIGYQTGNSVSGSNNVILGAYNGTGETINNNIILADGAGNKELQFSGSTWTTENNFVVSGSLSAANNIKMGRGVDKPTNKVTVGTGGLIVSNSLVTADSYIFATNDTTVGNYSPVVSNITAGSFSLSNGGYGGNIDVMYMIVNPY